MLCRALNVDEQMATMLVREPNRKVEHELNAIRTLPEGEMIWRILFQY